MQARLTVNRELAERAEKAGFRAYKNRHGDGFRVYTSSPDELHSLLECLGHGKAS